MLDVLKWAASLTGILAAFMVSLDSGRRVTGWGFVLFVFSSLGWIAASLMDKEGALGTQNLALLAINLFGVYRYLLRKRAPGQVASRTDKRERGAGSMGVGTGLQPSRD